VLEQSFFDPLRGRRSGGHHHGVGVGSPAGQVDDADQLAGHWMVDGRASAGQVLEVLDVVLVPEDLGRAASLQRGANPVGSDVLFGVAEPDVELDPVQMCSQGGVAGAPI
jgi:hypothetical protein